MVAPLLQGRRPRNELVLNRMRAFGGFLRLLPSMWRDRVFRSGKT
jgi:hypothetical protein